MFDVEPLSLFALTGRVAVVTGAADGLGYAIAVGLARAARHPAGQDGRATREILGPAIPPPW